MRSLCLQADGLEFDREKREFESGVAFWWSHEEHVPAGTSAQQLGPQGTGLHGNVVSVIDHLVGNEIANPAFLLPYLIQPGRSSSKASSFNLMHEGLYVPFDRVLGVDRIRAMQQLV